jgi:hypothetical protein
MKKLYAAVGPKGFFDFYSIKHNANKVKINPSDEKYGQVRVKSINMKRYAEPLPALHGDANLWDNHKIAFIWSNPDGSYWWDTLSQSVEETKKWCSKPEVMIALGFKIVPVQFSLPGVAQLMAA